MRKIVKISKGGQISIPASVRKRWNVRNVRIIDEGDQLIVRPQPNDPVAAVRGIFAGQKISTAELRRIAREDERRAEERKYRQHYGKRPSR